MNESKLIEFIRNILIKTVLPIRKRIDFLLSKIHLSIKLRIAFVYGKILMIHGIIMILVFCLGTLTVKHISCLNQIKEIVSNLEQEPEILNTTKLDEELNSIYNITSENQDILSENPEYSLENYKKYIYQSKINKYSDSGMTMKVIESTTNEVVYNDMSECMVEKCQYFNKAYFSKYNDNYKLFVIETKNITLNNQPYKIYFQVDYSQSLTIFFKLVWIMLGILLLLTILLARGGINQIDPIFIPLKQMAQAADRLTVNNLKSERLNIEGTKNELRDLASTINRMLDRLDLSYESQKQFVSDASHELRTPIAVIQGYIDMLDRWGKEDPEILAESITAIKNEANSMQDLVEKLLFLSRHDKKTLKLDKKVINMRKIINEMAKESKLIIKNRTIICDVSENAYVYADKQSIKQALRIFIDNAAKYSEDGDSIILECKSQNGSCVVSIEDTGLGMIQKDVENMFERFYRSDNVRGKQIVGNGLGLSLAKLIIMKHTGTIKVRTQFTKGTKFTIVFPPVEIL